MRVDNSSGSCNKINLLDSIITQLAFWSVIALFVALCVASVSRGTSSADDAWIALAAKNLAEGKGYSTTFSSNKLIPYDPGISTGPPLVLPTAAAIKIAGNLSWLPGAVQSGMFIAQLALLVLLLSRHFGWQASLSFVTLLTFLLINISLGNNWYYGALLGEPVAIGFILLGIALLVFDSAFFLPFVAGIFFSLAFLTKQIALFPIAGVCGAWLIINAYDRNSISLVITRCIGLGFGFLIFPLAFEYIRFKALGYDTYLLMLKLVAIYGTPDFGTVDYGDRLKEILDVSLTKYALPAATPWLILFPAVLLLSTRNLKSTITRDIVFLALGGIASHLLYMILFSPFIWSRYLWPGVALAVVIVSVPLLTASAKQRLVFTSSVIVMLFLFGGFDPALNKYREIDGDIIADERAAIVSYLDKNIDTPYASESWSSIYDIVYLRKDEGSWRCGEHLQEIHGESFIAVINHLFTVTGSDFYRSVHASCEPIHQLNHFSLLNCGQSFWAHYGDSIRPGCAHLGPSVFPTK